MFIMPTGIYNCKDYEMDFWENDAAEGVLDDFELEIKTNSGQPLFGIIVIV